MKTITKIKEIVGKLNDYICYLSCAVFVAILAVTVWHILGRLFFNAPIRGITDIVGLGNALTLAFCVAWVEKKGDHIRVDFIAELFPGAFQRVVYVFVESLAIITVGIIAYKFFGYTLSTFKNGNETSTVYLPYWPAAASLFVGFVMYCLTGIVNLAYKIATWVCGEPEKKEENAV